MFAFIEKPIIICFSTTFYLRNRNVALQTLCEVEHQNYATHTILLIDAILTIYYNRHNYVNSAKSNHYQCNGFTP